MEENTFTASDWPDEFSELRKVDELLRCGICYEYLNIAMMTTYCSVCIRKYMSYKSVCPTCFVITSEPELKPNRILDQLINNFTSLRFKLLQTLKTCDSNRSELSNKRKIEMVGESIPMKKRKEENASLFFKSDNAMSKNFNGDIFSNDDEKVTCPVCAVSIPARNINRHVERCLDKAESIPKEKEERKLKPLPKLVYHLMSERDLKIKLKQHGLSVQGERPALIKRHHSFTILYNANCDSIKPKPISALVHQVEKEERTIASKMDKIKFLTKKEEPIDQEQQTKGYLKEHKGHFDKLIEDIKQRKKSASTSKQIKVVQQPELEIVDSSQEEIDKIVDSISETDLDEDETDKPTPSPDELLNITLPLSLNENSQSSSLDLLISTPNELLKTSVPIFCHENSHSSSFDLRKASPIITSYYHTDQIKSLDLGHSSRHQHIVLEDSQDSNSSNDSLSLLQ